MFYILSLGGGYQGFEIWCVFYTYSASPFRLAAFQMLSNIHMWLVATILDRVGTEA